MPYITWEQFREAQNSPNPETKQSLKRFRESAMGLSVVLGATLDRLEQRPGGKGSPAVARLRAFALHFRYFAKKAEKMDAKGYSDHLAPIQAEFWNELRTPVAGKKTLYQVMVEEMARDAARLKDGVKKEDAQLGLQDGVDELLENLSGNLNFPYNRQELNSLWVQDAELGKEPEAGEIAQQVPLQPDKRLGAEFYLTRRGELIRDTQEAEDYYIKVHTVSEILACDFLAQNPVRAGTPMTRIDARNDIVREKLRIQRSIAFNLAIDDMGKNALHRAITDPRYMDRLKAKMQTIQKDVNQYRLGRDSLLESRAALQKHIKALEDTKRGSYLGMTRWTSNSDTYDKALEAARKLASAGPTYNRCKAVRAYTDRYREERDSEFGRIRFAQFMGVLSHAMKPEAFAAYCDEINKTRGVTNKPYDSKYITPDDFLPALHPVEAAAEIRRRNDEKRHARTITPRDWARELAARRLSDRALSGNEAPQNQNPVADYETLRKETNAILGDSDFRTVIEGVREGRITEFTADQLPQYKELARQLREKAAKEKKQEAKAVPASNDLTL